MEHLVVGGHVTQIPEVITYSTVVTSATAYIAFTVAVLHDLEVKRADLLNAYATNKEKIRTLLGTEFGDDSSKCAIIVRALYRLKCAGAYFRTPRKHKCNGVSVL